MASIGVPELALIASLGFLLLLPLRLLLPWLRRSDDVDTNWPLLGMMPALVRNLHRIQDFCTEVLEMKGGNAWFTGFWFSNMEILCTVDPANVHHIMSSNFSNFPKGPDFKKIFDIFGDGIFNSDSDSWRSQRKMAQGFIAHGNTEFQSFLVKTSRAKIEKGLVPVLEHVLKQGTVVDFQDLFQRFTFDSTWTLVTGYDPGCLSSEFPQVRFSKAMDEAGEGLFYRHFIPETFLKLQRWLGVGVEKRMLKARETLDYEVNEYLSRKREEFRSRINSNEERPGGTDLLTSYMKQNMGSESEERFLRDTVVNLLIAGRDTTSSALTWFFWLITRNPKVENKIRDELKQAGERWKSLEMEDLNKLVYLHASLCEAMRLYPPVPFQHKTPVEPTVLPSGHRVVPKVKIIFFLYAMGRMKSIWGDDCLEFKPERWISESNRIKHVPSYKFPAFNVGPRSCLGKEVAFIQMKAVAATIIHNYQVEVVDEEH
nr:cytochrome P450 CYP96-1a [Daphne genkwa]